MKTQVKMLKVKIKSLAEEARIIRLEERRACGRRKAKTGVHPDYKVWVGRDDVLRESLHRHRIDVVRAEQRVSLLAYAYVRGVPFRAAEPKCATEPDWDRVRKLVEKFGGLPYQPAVCTRETILAWRNASTVPAVA